VIEPFFFADDLLGVWRDVPDARRAWVLAPPFGEEEKSARRVLTEIAALFCARGESSLLFSFRGQGDSGGDFAQMSLSDWRTDLENAVEETKRRAPDAQIALLGVRLGGSLCLEVGAARTDVGQLLLIEPLLSGKGFLSQQLLRQKIRAGLTDSSSALPRESSPLDDLDGWPLGARMKSDLNALDFSREVPTFTGQTRVFQVGPKAEVAPPLRAFAEKLGAPVEALVMPPFWNLLDYSSPRALLERI